MGKVAPEDRVRTPRAPEMLGTVDMGAIPGMLAAFSVWLPRVVRIGTTAAKRCSEGGWVLPGRHKGWWWERRLTYEG